MEQVQTLDPTEERLKIVTFHVNDEEYGVDISMVNSIERMTKITRVPNVGEHVLGVMNLRGNVIPVIDLRKRFQLESREFDEETRIIVIGLQDLEVGVVVDSCGSVTDILRKDIEPPPSTISDVDAAYIQGATKLGNRLIVLLDMEETINPKKAS